MSHLPMHLIEELIILGPAQVRWMYPVERTMQTLKNHVKNRARPEASIAHGYLLDETIGFAKSYMHGFDVVRRRVWDAVLKIPLNSKYWKEHPLMLHCLERNATQLTNMY